MRFEKPLLFTFRRCPYAIRARLALALADIDYDTQEVDLKNKPERFLQLSSKATVPVLLLADGQLIEQSLDIMFWALQRSDPAGVLPETEADRAISMQRIAENDGPFKLALDRYKYPERHAEYSALELQQAATQWIVSWNTALMNSQYFLGNTPSLADYALLPFVRQFTAVNQTYFDALPVAKLQAWLHCLTQTELFKHVMRKT
jgi:glutathione S-transferase